MKISDGYKMMSTPQMRARNLSQRLAKQFLIKEIEKLMDKYGNVTLDGALQNERKELDSFIRELVYELEKDLAKV